MLTRCPRGLDRLPDGSPARRVLCSSRRRQKSKMPDGINHRAFYSGDVLLSHGLSPYYHRGCSVSLPCSEWERVGPLRYCHQTRGALALLGSGGGASRRVTLVGAVYRTALAIEVNRRYLKFQKNYQLSAYALIR